MINKYIFIALLMAAAAAPQTGAAQKVAYNSHGAGNPILPGYFADPTIKKFGDTYYIYTNAIFGFLNILQRMDAEVQRYQYLIETSNDGKHWQIFFDKRQNRLAGSPMVDFGNSKAQYIRLTYTGGQKNGFGGAIWNLKVYGTVEDSAPQQWLGLTAADYDGTSWHNNEGMLGGEFSLIQGTILRERIDCKDALTMQPEATLVMKHPQLGKNRKHTLTAMAFDNGSWYQIDENHPRLKLSEGNDACEWHRTTLWHNESLRMVRGCRL